MHPMYIWNLQFLQHREPLFSVAKTTMAASSSNCIALPAQKRRNQWGVDMWFITESIGLNFFFSWSRQNLIIRFSTQMGDSRCVFNFNRLDRLVNNKEIYHWYFFYVNGSPGNQLTYEVVTFGASRAELVSALLTNCIWYIIIAVMSLQICNSKVCRCDIIQRSREWL